MSLSDLDISKLLGLLSLSKCQTQSFSSLAQIFSHQFSKSQDPFRLGTAILVLLQHEDLLVESCQRLVALFLLLEIYKSEPVAHNPFAPVFVHAMQANSTEGSKDKHASQLSFSFNSSERHFLSQLISSSSKELLRHVPSEVTSQVVDTEMVPDISGLQMALAEHESTMPYASKAALPAVVAYPDFSDSAKHSDVKKVLSALLKGSEAPAIQNFRPEFITLPPPLHQAEDELVWLSLTNYEYRPVWDYSMGRPETTVTEFRKLVQKAFKSTITQNMVRKIQETLEKEPDLCMQVGLRPDRLAELVERSPIVACELIVKMVDCGQVITEYLSALVGMQLSLQSMEVVNRLTTSVQLPQEFVLLYITNCISTCDDITEKPLQNRLVRLVCVFLQALIRNGIVDVKDILLDVQAFCIEHSKIREAAALFRLIKQIPDAETT